jgi:hypothetical protein
MLTGDGAPLDPVQAARLLAADAEESDSEAAALLATVEAMGVAGPQNWDRALEWLRKAASLGSERAQAQLALLDREGGIAAMLAAPPKRSLSDAPRIRVIEKFASPEECDWVMARAHGRLGPAMVLDKQTGREKTHPDRTNKAIELDVPAMDVVLQVIRARIAAATNLPLPVFEPAQIMHYSVGEEFRPHYDFLTQDADGWAAQLQRYGQRIATFLLYLNDDFEGGETDFPSIGLSHRGGKGDALFFANIEPSGAPDRRTLHAGRPPSRGQKWILSQWIRDRTPAPA